MYILSGQTPYRTRRCVDIAQAVCGQNCSNRFHGDKQRGPFPLDSVSTNFNRWIGSGKSSERFTLAKQKTSLYQLIQSWDSDNRWWQLCWGNMVYNQLSVTKDEKEKTKWWSMEKEHHCLLNSLKNIFCGIIYCNTKEIINKKNQ